MELEIISQLIDRTPTICDYVLQDLNEGKVEKQNTGAEGMSADQVLRAAVVMQLYSFTYEQLAFHIYDSRALSRFCRIGIADKGFGKSALNANIKRISPAYMGMHFPGPVGTCQRRKHRERSQDPHRLYGG
jgi:IS5 family transposase